MAAARSEQERYSAWFEAHNKALDSQMKAHLLPPYLAAPNRLEAREICSDLVRESQPRFVPIGDDNG